VTYTKNRRALLPGIVDAIALQQALVKARFQRRLHPTTTRLVDCRTAYAPIRARRSMDRNHGPSRLELSVWQPATVCVSLTLAQVGAAAENPYKSADLGRVHNEHTCLYVRFGSFVDVTATVGEARLEVNACTTRCKRIAYQHLAYCV